MEKLFNLTPEKYWDFTKKYTKEQKESEILTRISSNDYISSLKKDGHYNRFVKNNGECRMESRTLSTVTGEYSDKSAHVPHISNTLRDLPDNTILIGELYYHDGTSAEAGKILQCKPDKAVERQEKDYGFLFYYIHDCWFFNGEDLRNTPYKERIEVVKNIYNKYLKANKYIECAEYASTPEDIATMLNFARENDEEGIVMVRKDATVNPGARTAWKTIKVKKELEKEVDCFLTGRYKEATRLYTGKDIENWLFWEDLKTGELKNGDYYSDYDDGATIEPVTKPYFFRWAGSLELGILKDGKSEVLGYVSGISDEIKKDIILNNSEYINRPCCVSAMQWTEDNKLRHPKFIRFRDDISLEDCCWEKV